MKRLFTIATAMAALLLVSAGANAQFPGADHFPAPPRPKVQISVNLGTPVYGSYDRYDNDDRHDRYDRRRRYDRHRNYGSYNRHDRHDRYDRHDRNRRSYPSRRYRN